MNYNIHTLVQGSAEWKAHRAGCYNASDLSAAMGISSYKTRTDLIRQMATGIEPEIDAATQRRFDDGHRYEALARPIAERIIGRDLYPITASLKVDGLAKPVGASLDGATDDDTENFEHKSLNATLAAALDQGTIPEEYWPQMEQGMLVNGAVRTLFMASKWDENDTLIEEKHCWYESKPELRAKIVLTWQQLEADVAGYEHVEPKPAVVAAPVEGFGTLIMQVEGRVVACNLDAFKTGAQAFLDRLPKASALQSDQDFADAEAAVKACSEAEGRIQSALDAAMAQAASIDDVFRAARHISELIRSARLSLDKSVKSRKESIRMEIMQDAQAKLAEHIKNLNERIGWFNGSPIMSPAAADFATAIKGKKTVAGLRDACDTELSRAKIASSEIADRIEINLRTLREQADGYQSLFPDTGTLVLKMQDDLIATMKARIAEHKEAEDRKRIEAERKAQAAACAANETPITTASLASVSAKEGMAANPALGQRETADDGERLKLGDINARLYPLSLTADSLKAIGFESVGTQGAAKLYRAGDFQAICAAIVRHVQSAATNQQMRKAA